ncbi:MAG: hypothetical protein Q9225_000645 [Loekoesia sp. 1 TL-2023]
MEMRDSFSDQKLMVSSTQYLKLARLIPMKRRMCALAPTVTMVKQDSRSQTNETKQAAEQVVGSITLLFQRSSQPGLELLSPHGGWYPVPVQPPGTEHDPFPPILVNVGDLLSYWTNGFLKSTVHKVVFPPDKQTTDRYSIAYFCHPANETRLTPVPSELVAKASASQEMQKEFTGSHIMTAEEHLRSRLAATYGWDDQSDKAGKEQ